MRILPNNHISCLIEHSTGHIMINNLAVYSIKYRIKYCDYMYFDSSFFLSQFAHNLCDVHRATGS